MNRNVCEHFNPVDLPCNKCRSANVQKSTLREAAKQALEALECGDTVFYPQTKIAIAALRAALAEPVQEPVASVTECEACFTPDVCQLRGTCDHYAAERLRVAAPPQRKPLAEPVQEPVQEHEDWCASVTQLLLCDPPRKAPCNCKKKVAEPVQDWSLLEATQESLREHMAEIHRLRAALKSPVEEPVAWIHTDPDKPRVRFLEWRDDEPGYRGRWIKTPLYTAPPQRKPLTDE